MLEVSLFSPGADISKTLGYNFFHILLDMIKEDSRD